jgi:hypothetical protein
MVFSSPSNLAQGGAPVARYRSEPFALGQHLQPFMYSHDYHISLCSHPRLSVTAKAVFSPCTVRSLRRTLRPNLTPESGESPARLPSIPHTGATVSNHAAIFRQVLETDPQWLEQIRRGVEKESLRVTADQATLAQTPHPKGLGSTLTHPGHHHGLFGGAAGVHYPGLPFHR